MERLRDWFQKNTMAGFLIGIFLGVLLVVGCFTIYETQFSKSHEIQKESGTNGSEDTSVVSPSPEVTAEIVIPDSVPSVTPTATPTPIPSTPTPVITNPEQAIHSESDLVQYFQNYDNKMSTYAGQEENPTIRESAKNMFVKIVDFLFYGKDINGYTFSGLTTSAKLQVLKIAFSIDQKIDSYFPGYKDSIKAGFSKIKAELVNLYLDVTASACEAVGSDVCNQAKEDFKNMKNSFGFTLDLLKDLGGNAVNAIRQWYEIFRES